MSLRNKTYILLLVVTAIFLLVVYALIWRMTDTELHDLQQVHAEEQLALMERILKREMENLSIKQADWARWDDTYQFIADRNEQYIISNLNDESFALIDVDMMAFVNNSNEVVYSKQVYSGEPGTTTIPEKFLRYFQGETDLLDFGSDLISVKSGILTTSDAMLLVSAQPVSTSDGKGVRRGTLIFGRYIDAQYATSLSNLSGLRVQILPYGFSASPNEEKKFKEFQINERTAVEYHEGEVIALRLLDNIFSNPSLLLYIKYPSEIIEQGNKFLLDGLWYSLITLVSYVSVLIVLIDFFLLRRIENMRRIARQVGALQTGGLPEGDIDDFSYLASIMMGAIKNIEQSNKIAFGSKSEIDKLQVALDQSFDHMIITDSEGKILYANLVAEELTGYSRSEMIGQTPALWGRQMSADFYREFWDTIRLHKKMFEGEIINKHKNGSRYRAKVRVTPILSSKQQVLYFIGVERFIGKVA